MFTLTTSLLVQRQAHTLRVLHRDPSLHNAMIEDVDDGSSVGMLIDWEFAVDITPNDCYTIGGTVSRLLHWFRSESADLYCRARGRLCHADYCNK
jgi:hypothetical protein